MNGLIKQISLDKTILWSMILSLVILVVSLVLVLIFYRSLPPLVPLFNQLPWGTERLSTKINLLLPIALAFIFLISNSILTKYIYEKIGITARMLAVTTVLISILAFIFIARIIQLIL